jgi:GAF domain-containing protein
MHAVQAAEPVDPVDCGALCDPERLRALAESGLTARADPDMEQYAERVRRWLGVPVALVSLVQPDRQVFPGSSGLPEPWASTRLTPLSHSFCQHVVITAEPLIVTDAREHPLVRDNRAVAELGVIAYAGMPLTDAVGNVLGSLCAIDTEPRHWTEEHLDALRDLARSCSTELRLRLARHDAGRERAHRDGLEQELRRAYERSQTLLLASQAFTDTATVEDVRGRVSELVRSELQPGYVGLVLLDERGRMVRVHDEQFPPGAEDVSPWIDYGLDAALPTAAAVREERVVHYANRADFDAAHPAPTRALLRELGMHAVAAVPLLGTEGSLGAVMLGWNAPRAVDPADLLMITTIAGYAAQAIDRAQRLQHRDGVANELQQAMLTTLPLVPGLAMAARYQSADVREHVGGDWYDAALIPDPGHRDREVLTLSVGDVIGHNLQAATIMGQIRSMLRQSAWDHPGRPPSRVFSAFEHASIGLGLSATGTAVLAQLRRRPDGRWSMAWTNAGHPPPILLTPDGTTTVLDHHDILFGFSRLDTRPRTDRHIDIDPGSTLFLYTDGLVERRGSDIDAGTDRLVELLESVRGRPPAEMVDHAVTTLAQDSPDDVVAFAVRFVGGPG